MTTPGEYMKRYDDEHHHPVNKLLHALGIPMILLGMLLLATLVHWRAGLLLFAGGWALLLLGHRIEGNHPAFFQGPAYFLIGPIWVAREIKETLFSSRH